MLRDNICGITRGRVRRIARRGGVKRISAEIYEGVRRVLKAYVEDIVRCSTAYAENARKKTVTAADVVNALRKKGHILYGYASGNRHTVACTGDVDSIPTLPAAYTHR
ncbi:histone H4 [Leishmania mexicana MHOM/GT/2001/U1103]|uniref:Histone H4 n=1 Tax=Leishmania mexicana (strain MHOM/GT/2001/U1103) TaxID=929439 RepID=E9AUW4_LEIMU|nr:histone H4 [Leishmania mexicana MHOM/GT/2001/U1103]CBZ26745.1 histone H4 [Leishmania mexicana MHOM/GT/2001/U1103]